MNMTTKEGAIKTFSTITFILIIIGTATYFKFVYYPHGGMMQDIVGDDTKPRRSLMITEEWSRMLPINTYIYPREKEMWIEINVVGGGSNGDYRYEVPPKSMREKNWVAPEISGVSLQIRLSPGKNSKKITEIFYVSK